MVLSQLVEQFIVLPVGANPRYRNGRPLVGVITNFYVANFSNDSVIEFDAVLGTFAPSARGWFGDLYQFRSSCLSLIA
jgi:hypothetical protein